MVWNGQRLTVEGCADHEARGRTLVRSLLILLTLTRQAPRTLPQKEILIVATASFHRVQPNLHHSRI